MCRYYMELPDSGYVTIQIAYDYIKKTYPHLTDGFSMTEEIVHNFIFGYPKPVFYWYSNISFLGWGAEGGTKIPFPDVDCILLGEIK